MRRDRDDLVRGHALLLVNRAALDDLIGGVFLQSRDEMHARGDQRREPGMADVTLVEDDDRAFGQLERLGHLCLVAAGIGDAHESRDVAGVVEQRVELDAAAILAEARPRQAELDGRGVEAEELVFETEFMSGRDGLAALVERAEEFGEEVGGSPVVGVGKRGAGHGPQAKVVKPASIGVEITDAVTHGRSGCEVNEGQADELAPAGEDAGLSACRVLALQIVENMSGKQG